MSDDTLTYAKLNEMLRSLPAPAPRNDLFNPLPMRFMGMPVYEAPPPPPKLQVRDIKFSDGTSILPAAFRAEMNLWLLERFGFAEDMFKDKIYLLGSYGMVASPKNAAMIRNICS